MISIIIVNWNGRKWLEKCLSSLRLQTYKDFEIIFVDNASTDESVEYVKDNFPEVKIILSSENLWFAWGNNLGIKNTIWDYLLFLNNDTWMETSFLEKFILHFQNSEFDILWVTERKYDGTRISRLALPKIDLLGHPIYIPSQWESVVSENLFYVSGVCVLFRKDFYKKTGWLDNDFFMYSEEVDWIWRSRLYGWRIWQITDLYIYHAGAGSTGTWIKYNVFLWRNQNTLQMLLKNYAWYNLIWVLVFYLTINMAEMVFFLIIFKPKITYSYIEWWFYNIVLLSKTLQKRRSIQKNRVISDIEILKYMYKWPGKLKNLIKFYSK